MKRQKRTRKNINRSMKPSGKSKYARKIIEGRIMYSRMTPARVMAGGAR